MRRFWLDIAAGLVFGIVLLAAWDWRYEYRMAGASRDATDMVNCCSWRVVPNQPNGLYLERPRLHLP